MAGIGVVLATALVCAPSLRAATADAPFPSFTGWHWPEQPRSGQAVKITAALTNLPGVTNVFLQYQLVDPGRYIEFKDRAYQTNWSAVAMAPASRPGKSGRLYAAELPPALQIHRRLVRYRLVFTNAAGTVYHAPATNDSQPNFAYFVYDGVPAWQGAIDPKSREASRSQVLEFGTNVMRRLPVCHLVSKKAAVEAATWKEQYGGDEYKWWGTLVYDGQVYDHIRYRPRGGTWRFAMGKNMWKFALNKGHDLAVRDNFGQPYAVPWTKLNLGACIQQGQYGRRGEQGLYEATGFRLFNLAGVAAPHTHFLHFRIIDEALEANPANQYEGDFWGLYLAVEQAGGRFLKEHGLPDGNLYKMEGGTGELSNQGANAVTNISDLNQFLAAYQGGQRSEEWWRAHLDLPRYYSYRAILECIHHYDIGDGKNYFYFLNPTNDQWSVHPWDLDLTWGDHMYGGGDEPFRSRVLGLPRCQLEYQNRLREIRDLLFNPEQTGALIEEYAAMLAAPLGGRSFVEADRARWDYHPAMAGGGNTASGLFYQAAPTKDFRGMVEMMKQYVQTRGAWIDKHLLKDNQAPGTPAAMYIGPANYPCKRLVFRLREYQGANAFAAMLWRLAEITPSHVSAFVPGAPRNYEITALWTSGEHTNAAAHLTVPADRVKPGRLYRVRVRTQDVTGRFSHWSPPVEFAAGR